MLCMYQYSAQVLIPLFYFAVVVTGFEEATVTTLEGSTEFVICFVKNLTVDSFTFEIAALDGTAVDQIGIL